ARNIPQAHAALVAGRWERSRWEGVELADKTLGIVGLGRIGKLVAQRALAFGMRVVAHDPFVAPDRARQINVELMDLDELVAVADFLTLHVVKTPETLNLIDAELLAKAKPTLRIVNVSRGGVIDEAALADAIREGRIAGAALDVFATEPCTESPLFELPQVVVTPHLGASTVEAQDKAGVTIAEQVVLALAGEFVPFAVNVSAAEASSTVRPFLSLAERLGQLYGALAASVPDVLEVGYEGQLADSDTRILTLSVLKGVFGRVSHEPVSYVNAPRLAEERGVEVRESSSATSHEYINLITIRGGEHSIGGTLVGLRAEPRIVMVDDHSVDVPPAENMLVVRNDDKPGMIAAVTGVLGDAGINIDDMHLGRSPEGTAALMVLATDQKPSEDVLAAIRALPGVVSATAL
ncbi:MAG TPA: phosphoglycerate dehydrogenase, partial [Acidimicrobiales bacterium]|nr:phosphoglycerate dehydrogenase [Acidimicrobiales bacterium]